MKAACNILFNQHKKLPYVRNYVETVKRHFDIQCIFSRILNHAHEKAFRIYSFHLFLWL